MKKLKYLYKDLIHGITNLIIYFNVIWSDRQWDHSYIEKIWLAKYKRVYKRLTTVNRFVDSDEYNKALNIVILILERRRSDYYTDVWYDRYGVKQTYNWIPSTHCEDCSEMLITGLTDEEEVKSAELLRILNQKEISDWKLLMKLIEKYHYHWWD